jgi:predicted unusual protein kinase regulating ubiquinone biosynthesis (AarF/ABC1/UbiB family)
MKTSGMLPENFPLEHYLSQCGDLLKRETNYELEAENINLFSGFLNGSKVMHVPKVYNKLSTDQTLTMSFLEGRELSNIMEFDQSVRDEISLNLIELLFNEIFNFKMVQTDPNLANFLLTRGGKSICILDFGACCRVSEDTYRLYKELLSVALSLDLNCIKSFLQEKNFIPQETSMAGTKFLENIISVTINELSKDETFDFQKSKVFQLIVQENLNLYFDLMPSSVLGSDFIFIQRKIFGLILFFRSIGTKLPLLKILKHQANLLEL